MRKTEEEKLLIEAWDKIRSWVRTNCSFSGTEEFTIETTPFHWHKLEIFPSGECAASSGSWGNPGENRPHLVYGHDSYLFSTADNALSWYGDEDRLECCRKQSDLGVNYKKGKVLFHILKLLVKNWQSVKDQINARIAEYNTLKNFEP